MKIDTDTITITKTELKDAILKVCVDMADDYMTDVKGSPMGGLAVMAMGAGIVGRLEKKLFGEPGEEDKPEEPQRPQLKFGDE